MSECTVNSDKVNDFIMAYERIDDEIEGLREYAIKQDVPIIRDETKNFLDLILRLKKPKDVLELGTAIAYSTLVIYKACDNNLESIVTIEENVSRIKEAKVNIDKYFDKSKIKLIEGDITECLKNNEIKGKFDFIFLDAAKAQYIVWLPYLKELMREKAILVADNVFKDGEILESKYAILKRDRTIHKRMREFLNTISKDSDFKTTIFNLGDGISVSIKK